jgi:hypothetical protein
MPRVILALLVTAGLTGPALADLKIQDVKARHGRHGPERASLDVVPGDELIITFTATGVQTDKVGKCNCDMTIKITDANEAVLVNNTTPIKELMALAGGSLPGVASTSFGANTSPGKYVLTVTLADKILNETASFERAVTVVKPDFAVIRPRLSYDPDGKTSAGTTHSLGTQLHFRMLATNFDRSEKKIDLTMSVQYYDDKGQALMPRPLTAHTKVDDEDQVAKAEFATFNGSFACNRTGTFKLKVVITDNISKKTATFESPLKIVE